MDTEAKQLKLWAGEEPPLEGWRWANTLAEAKDVLSDGNVSKLSVGESFLDNARGAELLYWLQSNAYSPSLIISHAQSAVVRSTHETLIQGLWEKKRKAAQK